MELDCTLEYGVCHDIISKCRKDWTLAHDVKLLKYLEKFSQRLISRTGDALNSLEVFEKDLNRLSINIQSVSQRFQSLANKQFIEHCVLEDDVSAYSKPKQNAIEVPSARSNVLFNKALTSCLSSFHIKYNNYKDSYSVTNSSNGDYGVLSSHLLPPLIGSNEFNEYYAEFLSIKDKLKEPMQKSGANTDTSSDRQSLQETISLNSSSNVLDEDSSSYIGNQEGDPTSSSVSGEVDGSIHGVYSVVVPKLKRINSREPEDNAAQNNFVGQSNGYDSIINPLKSQSLFDDDDFEESPDDLFSYGKSKPFAEKASFVEDDEKVFSPVNKNLRSSPYNFNEATGGKDESSEPSDFIVSDSQPLFRSNTSYNKSVSTNQNSDDVKTVADDFKSSSNSSKTSKNSSSLERSAISSISKEEIKPNSSISKEEIKPNSSISKEEIKPNSSISKEEIKPNSSISKEEIKPNSSISNQEIKPNSSISKEEIKPNSSSSKISKNTSSLEKSTTSSISKEEIKSNSSSSKTSKSTSSLAQSATSSVSKGSSPSIYETASDQKGSPFSSLCSSSSKDKSFSLFSDNEDSDDELFSTKNKNTKENFKKILEGKISAFSGNSNFSGKLNKSQYDESSNSTSDYLEKSSGVESAKESIDDNSPLPSFDTSTLRSLAKSRPRIKHKRRPPSRKHLKDIQTGDPSDSESSKKAELFKKGEGKAEECASFSVLSPSTEEEDLFVVPTTAMVHEVSSSNLFLASSLLSPGSSLDNQNLTNDFNSQETTKAVKSSDIASDALFSSVISRDNNLEKDYSFFSGVPPPTADLKFDTKEENPIKKTDTSSKFSWNTKESLFDDSDDSDDDLFSNVSKKKLNDKKPPITVSNKKSESPTGTQAQSKSNDNNDFFKDIFSNNSDDDDLFKTKQTPAPKSKQNQSFVKSNPGKTDSTNEVNGNKLVKSTAEFKDPLSFFNETD